MYDILSIDNIDIIHKKMLLKVLTILHRSLSIAIQIDIITLDNNAYNTL